ncbi:MAG TPA: hypothetical protein VN137_10175, partial [Sphingomonas sp.]|nr:hypothetical protein [Sphingomonas sp.]
IILLLNLGRASGGTRIMLSRRSPTTKQINHTNCRFVAARAVALCAVGVIVRGGQEHGDKRY